ncbi:MAG TPA: hypothetical protein VI479_20295 [Blastocatellia bacterium]
MKRQLFSPLIMLLLVGLFSSYETYAQPANGELPGTKPNPTGSTPGAGGSKAGASVSGPPALVFGVERKGKLDPKTSKNESGSVFEEMLLRADSEDSLSFSVRSNDPSLHLRVFGRNNTEVALRKDPSGDFKIATSTGGLPANGDYRVRVTGARNGKGAIPFTIKVDRLGLTAVAYTERYKKIYAGYNDKDPASVDETVAKLERFVKEAPNYPTAFERLGIIYLEIRKDSGKAAWAFDQAIKTGGAARIQIAYDNKWKQMTKSRSGEFGFQDKRLGWLRIYAGGLTLHDSKDAEMVKLTALQITELSKSMLTDNMALITINNTRKPYIFAPESMRQVDADLIVKLIQNHVVGKAY